MSWRQSVNKPATKPAAPKPKFDTNDDDWETDITYENSSTEKSQRYGSTSIPGSGRVDHVDFDSIRDKIKSADNTTKEVYQEKNPNRGYGGKYGTEQVMDKSAADFSYKADIKKHSSQTDSKKGFGGEHGIDERAKDKSAVGFDYKAPIEKHSSQTDASKGFGGKYGVQKEEPASPRVVPSSPKPPTETKVIETPAIVTSSKGDVGNIRARFENMKKEQESETAKHIAEVRKNRLATEQQKQQSNNDDQENVKQQETTLTTKETTREPSPTRPKTPTEPEVSTTNQDENDDNNIETVTSTTTNEENKEKTDKFVGGINVTSLLRQRKTSSSSSKKDDDEDDWGIDKDKTNQQSNEKENPSSTSTDE